MEILLIVALLFGLSSAYRYGAPIGSCNEMFPVLHGVDARSDDPPFTITVNKNSYTAGSSIEVFVDAADKDPDDPTKEWFMEGILIMARQYKTAAKDCPTTPIGTWEVPDCDDFVRVIDCYPKQYDKSAVTHYTHVHAFNTTLTWKAPDTPVGHVYFVATIARNKERFWVNVQSETIMDPTDSSSVTKSCPKQKTEYTDPYKIVYVGAASFSHMSFVLISFAFICIFSL